MALPSADVGPVDLTRVTEEVAGDFLLFMLALSGNQLSMANTNKLISLIRI